MFAFHTKSTLSFGFQRVVILELESMRFAEIIRQAADGAQQGYVSFNFRFIQSSRVCRSGNSRCSLYDCQDDP